MNWKAITCDYRITEVQGHGRNSLERRTRMLTSFTIIIQNDKPLPLGELPNIYFWYDWYVQIHNEDMLRNLITR